MFVINLIGLGARPKATFDFRRIRYSGNLSLAQGVAKKAAPARKKAAVKKAAKKTATALAQTGSEVAAQ